MKDYSSNIGKYINPHQNKINDKSKTVRNNFRNKDGSIKDIMEKP